MFFRMFPPVELPPTWRVRKVEQHWVVLRLQPIRHFLYFPVAAFDTHKDALHYICKREGACEQGQRPCVCVREGRCEP